MTNRWGKNRNRRDFIFWGSKITADDDCMKLQDAPLKKSFDKPR